MTRGLAVSRSRRRSAPRVGLALAGGGPLGAIFEIGALCALSEAIDGLDFTALDGYVGVSAGGFIAAGLANGMAPRALAASFIENRGPVEDRIHPSDVFRPAWSEFVRRAGRLPGLAARAVWHDVLTRRSLLGAAERLGRALPAGVFSAVPLERRLREVFTAPGRTNDFRQLTRRLVLVATDLDTGEAAPFGEPGWDHVPISQAVAASAALPGVFPPVEIEGRWYVDGALKKTLHARVLLDMGMDLVLCLNPLVPFDASSPLRHRVLGDADVRIPHLVDGGLPLVLSQTFRSLIHSRLELGLQGYATSHPQTDLLLFEPDQRDPELFVANTFAFSMRRLLAEHAYQRTRSDLRSRRNEIRTVLGRHGLALNDEVLDDRRRTLVPRRRPSVRRAASPAATALRRLDELLDDLEHTLQGLGEPSSPRRTPPDGAAVPAR
jgi:predicted acylesterase/phospholipase RssA